MRIGNPADPDSQRCAEARYRCGFGCIRCGCTVFRYCAVESADTAEGELFLLCPPCLETMNANPDAAHVLAVLLRNPLPLQARFRDAALPYMHGDGIPDTHFVQGPALRATAFPIVFDGTPLIALVPPEVHDGPVRLSVTLGGADGQMVELVKANEWMAHEDWRFERHNARYVFSAARFDAGLHLTFEPGPVMRIDRLFTRSGFRFLEIDAAGCRVDGQPVEIRGGASRLIGMRL